MKQTLLIIENDNTEDFYPFNILHCTWEIRIGSFMQFERLNLYFPEFETAFYTKRDLHLKSFLKRFSLNQAQIENSSVLIVFADIVYEKSHIDFIKKVINEYPNSNSLPIKFVHNDTLAAVYFPLQFIEKSNIYDTGDFERIAMQDTSEMLTQETNSFTKLNYLFDAIDITGKFINDDNCLFSKYITGNSLENLYPTAYFLNNGNIMLGQNVRIAPGCVIDAEQGTVIIDDNAKIMPHSAIIGPCYIGRDSTVKIGSKIYENTAIGNNCKVGGEIEGSIIQSFSNKQHDGFLGHSYISEWVNLGAGTNNSDLKNTYSLNSINLRDRTINTGKIFMGLLCGDHTKTAINTTFNTASVAGICCLLAQHGFLPVNLHSFSWLGKSHYLYKYDKALETAEIVMKRRNRILSDEERLLMKIEFDKIKK
jgi:UDP-N-acetylglucosamine diphosphorylase / glucose-1-phosphate thymidylyltransferase / UDP-N-acetylgalactosamine diphosphorylase / glucosamine-1-phosphate N-acetyltransferase / galactosamine-1-phosphate N-acetyltransferase